MIGSNKIFKIKQILIKNTWLIINFTFGLLVGYGLGIIQIHKIFAQNINFKQNLNIWSQVFLFLDQLIWKPFLSFSPSFKFVSDVIAYQAAIVAIAIPVSLDIISRISERYQSGIITKEFNQQWQLRTLLVLVVTDALSGVILKFFVVSSTETVDTIGWKIVAWIILFFFMVTNIVLFAFFDNLRKYSTSTKFLLDKLFNELDQYLKVISSKKKIRDAQVKDYQEKLIRAFEGIGDILIFESKNKKNSQYIIDSIYNILEKSKIFFKVSQEYPERFQRLLYSQEIFQPHKSNGDNVNLAIAFFPERYLSGYMAIVNQFMRIHEAALEARNYDISRRAIYGLLNLLEQLSQDKNNSILVETLLGTLNDLFISSREQPDYVSYLTAINWYLEIVPDEKFNIEYLNSFDSMFSQNLRQIIYEERYTLFEQFLSGLHTSGGFSSNERFSKTYSYLQIQLSQADSQRYDELESECQFDDKISQLIKNTKEVRTIERLKEVLDSFEDTKTSVRNHFKVDYEKEIYRKFEEIYDEIIQRFKFNNIVDILFDIGSYCIFERRYEYLKNLWIFRQPQDSDAIWCSPDFIPERSPKELIDFYFKAPFQDITARPNWKNHHGSERYYNQYFLILLLRVFLNSRISSNLERKQVIQGFNFSTDFNSIYLNNIKYIAQQTLIPLAMNLNSQLDSLLQILGFDVNQLSDAIQYGLIAFLENLAPKVDQQLEILRCIGKISPKKVEIFKQDFLRGYEEGVSIQDLFDFYGLYECNVFKLESKGIPPLGFKHTYEKSILFEDWYVQDSHIGFHLGQSLVTRKEIKLMITMLQSCTIRQDTNLKQILSENLIYLDEFIIIAVNINPFELFEDLLQVDNINYFKQRGDLEESERFPQAFAGLYIYKGYEIPLFSYFCHVPDDLNISDKSILILNRKYLGKLVQYAPAPSEEVYQVKKCFCFKFEVYSENQGLMNQLIEQSPAWLSEMGDELQQKNTWKAECQ